MLPDDTRFITDEASLRAPYPQPMLRATGKVLRAVDKYCRRIIALSPFASSQLGVQTAPTSRPVVIPGLVRVLDDLTRNRQ